MGDNLSQDGLRLVSECFVRCLVTVVCQLERLGELPLEVDRQADWDLVASEAGKR